MGIPSDRRFLAVASKHLRHLFPQIPAQPGYFERRRRLLAAPDWTPRAIALTSPKRDEREVALELIARTHRDGPVTVIGDKGYAGKGV